MTTFFVVGTPRPAGSKRGFVVNGKAVLTDTSGIAGKHWRTAIQDKAVAAFTAPIPGPVCIAMTFFLQRPKAHLRKDGTVKAAAAQACPTTRPDVLKLARAVEDALTGIAWRDDAQIVSEVLAKLYTTTAPPGVVVSIGALPEDAA